MRKEGKKEASSCFENLKKFLTATPAEEGRGRRLRMGNTTIPAALISGPAPLFVNNGSASAHATCGILVSLVGHP